MDDNDVFKVLFKYYKSRKPKPSLDRVVFFDDKLCENVSHGSLINNEFDEKITSLLGLKNIQNWKLCTFQCHPGLFLIRNPFTALGQRYWIRRCLEEYSKKPNITNLDIEVTLEDWWSECYKNGTCDRQLQKKMRWATLGYHHNWDTKVYSDDNKSSFPLELAELSDVVAKVLGYNGFKAEAAIVNYYHMDSTLSPHTDHSEVNLEAPLLSFSFGQSAIFLLGGKEKSIEPSAIMLNSGDIVIMSKDARLCYHAVPKILPAQKTPWNDRVEKIKTNEDIQFKYISNRDTMTKEFNKNIENAEWARFDDYISESRINMNIRQVLYENQTSLSQR